MFHIDDFISYVIKSNVCGQDFDTDPELKAAVRDLLEEMVNNSCLLPAEHKAASSILCVLIKDAEVALKTKVNLEILLAPPEVTEFLNCEVCMSIKYL